MLYFGVKIILIIDEESFFRYSMPEIIENGNNFRHREMNYTLKTMHKTKGTGTMALNRHCTRPLGFFLEPNTFQNLTCQSPDQQSGDHPGDQQRRRIINQPGRHRDQTRNNKLPDIM